MFRYVRLFHNSTTALVKPSQSVRPALRDRIPQEVVLLLCTRELAEIYGCFTEGFDTADLKDAKALLDELGT
jgi:hypothetical protein